MSTHQRALKVVKKDCDSAETDENCPRRNTHLNNNVDFHGNSPQFQSKILILSHVLPPSPSGQAIVLYRLLKGIDPDSYGLVSCIDYDDTSFMQKATQWLPAPYHWLGRAPQIRSFVHPILNKISIMLNIISKIIYNTWRLQRIVRQGRYRSIIVCTGDPCDLPVSYLTSLITRIPLYLYYFDYFSEQWAATPVYGFATVVERLAVKRAKGIVVPNEIMKEELRERYGSASVLIRNPIFSDNPVLEGPKKWPRRSGEVRIVYTGAIYRAQSDAFRTLLQALDELSLPNITLHLYTAQTREELEKQAIFGSYVLHPHASNSVIQEIQREADILYLPLSFDPEISKVINTSSPGKMGEYLVSGSPVLVHAPQSSYISIYFKRHQCGLVIDRNEPTAIKNGIIRLISDRKLRYNVSVNAFNRAKADFIAKNGQIALLRLVNNSV